MTSPRRPGHRPRSLTRVGAWLLAVLAAVGLLVLSAGTASAAPLPDGQTRVRASAPETITAVGVSEHIAAGQGRGPPTLWGQIVVATGVAADAGAGSVLRASSEAAFRAADNPGAIFIKNKHLASSVGRWAKFDSTDVGEVQGWVAEALRSDGAVFRPNNLADTFKVEVNMGRAVGTRGETGIRVIVTNDGRVINAFPFNAG